MALMTWTPGLSVGVPPMDAQHQRLIALVNKLHEAMSKGVGKQMLGTVLDELVAYTRQHFSAEELLMTRHGYPDVAAHVAEHRKLVATVQKLQSDLTSGTLLTIEVMEFLKQWLSGHILGVDSKYGPYLADRVA
jgi:hemerythrin